MLKAHRNDYFCAKCYLLVVSAYARCPKLGAKIAAVTAVADSSVGRYR